VYNPAKDAYLKQNFTPETIEKRLANKIALKKKWGYRSVKMPLSWRW